MGLPLIPVEVEPCPDRPGFYRHLDGVHRWNVYKATGVEMVTAIIKDLAGEDPLLYAAAKAIGPKQLTEEEARDTARRAYSGNPRLRAAEIGKAIGRSRQTVDTYIADLRAVTLMGRDIKIFRMHHLGMPQDRFKALGWGFRTWDQWEFNDCDNRFGDDWPGRIPAQLVAHILRYFSQPGDLFLDPMAGGGVTPDTCLAMNRRCWAFDMEDRPDTRPEIEPFTWEISSDQTLSWPFLSKEKTDLVIFDPPYFDKKAGDYKEDQALSAGIRSLPEMASYIENFHSDNLFHFDVLKKPYPEIVDPELQFIDQLLDDQIINSLIAPEGYSAVHRDIQPYQLFRMELLKIIKYPEISYRKFCSDEYFGRERKQNRRFVRLPLDSNAGNPQPKCPFSFSCFFDRN